MKKLRILLALVMALTASAAVVASTPQQAKALTDFLDRIGGDGASKLIVTDVDPSLSVNGKERFVITSQDGKPAVKGSSLSAVTTGINWYLNHYAHI
ncbi:MAG: alpha-N-acetylglucosaminidase N-terminal domain-containing protein, partial [Paramuribaculum sp.]|nr:alpha-N-acetylglucosaminidase N-terminal domain-containing protein [Paramuribaculum sp.]